MTPILLSLMLHATPAFAEDDASQAVAEAAAETVAPAEAAEVKGWHVSRTVEIKAPADVVWTRASDYNAWPDWTNWSREMDPECQWTFAGEPSQVGQEMSWDGPKLKTGRMKTTAIDGTSMTYDLWFGKAKKPNPGTLTVTSTGEDTSSVTWDTSGHMGFLGRLFFRKAIEKGIGTDFEVGLQRLGAQSAATYVEQLKAEAEQANTDAVAKMKASEEAQAEAMAKKTELEAAEAAVTAADEAAKKARRGKAKTEAEAALAAAKEAAAIAGKAADAAAENAAKAKAEAEAAAKASEAAAAKAARFANPT